MCPGILHTHAQCGHHKKFVALDYCTDAPLDGACNVRVVIHTTLIREPALCVGCFRRVEADIAKDCETKTKRVEERIENLTLALRAEMDAEARERMRKHRSVLTEEVGDLKDKRNEEIAEFRFRQGVWADG
ncbi:hypothetical protein MMC28_008441 [Mycoblastus sanguinarius]|nr:hypothetical protein [Mycoblastus sanguinarius]